MTLLEFGSENTGPVTLFLHGFPSIKSKQNRDLAAAAARTKNRRCYLPLYDGLGHSPGTFSFQECLAQVQELTDQLLTQYGSLDLVGHSWGGYLSLCLASRHQAKIARMVLMSPLLYFFTIDLSAEAFRLTQKEHPELNLGSIDDLSREFHKLGNRLRADDFAKAVSPKTEVAIFQAANDDTTPASYVENLVNRFQVRPRYEVVTTDHSFVTARAQALDRVLSAL